MEQGDGMELVLGMGLAHGKEQAHDTLAHGGMAHGDKEQVDDKLVHDMEVMGDDKELVHGDRGHVDGD